MIITYIMGGIGNQLYQYAAGRRLAQKWNTELKLDTTFYVSDHLRPYALDKFNITAAIATPEEIARVKASYGGGELDRKKNASWRKRWISLITFGSTATGVGKSILPTSPTSSAASSR